MAQADGTIIIDTEIKADGMKAGSKDIESTLRKLASSVENLGSSAKNSLNKQIDSFAKLNNEYAAQEKKVESLRSKVSAYKNEKIPTTEYKEIQEQISKAEKDLNKLVAAQERFISTGGKTSSTTYKRYQHDIEQLSNSIKYAKGELEDLEEKGKAFTIGNQSQKAATDMEKLAAAERKLADMNNRLNTSYSSIKNKINEYNSSTKKSISQTGFLQSALNGLKMAAHAPVSMIKDLGKSLLNLPMNALRTTVGTVTTAFEKLGKTVKKVMTNLLRFAGGKITSGLKKISKGILGINKSANKTNMTIGKMLGMSVLYSMTFQAISAVINGAKEGLQNLAQYSGTTNNSLSMLVSSLETLKNSFASAFAPILSVVAPILSSFINMISQAVTYVGMFIAALTGQKTYSKALGIQKNYAASLEDTASGASDAADETDKAAEAAEGYLSPLDKINKWDKKENAPSKSDGKGGAGAAGLSPSDMFETVEIEPISFDSWGAAFDSFLDYLLNTGIPALRNALSNIANVVNTFSSNLYEMFTFPGVLEKVQLLGQEIAIAFNDFVNWIDWEMLGSALGAGFNLAIQFLVNLIYTFDWLNLGASLATMINNAISEIDWYAFGQLLWAKFKIAIETLAGFLLNLDMAQLAQAASNIVIGFFNSITETIQNIDWQKLGEQVKTFLVNVDWAGVAEAVFTAIGSAFGAAAAFLWGLIKDAWQSVIDWWHETAFEDGKFTITGLLDGIVEIFKNIGSWIKEHIFQPFIDGFKSIFGINSPSKVMMEMGKYLIEGLFNGINSLVEKVISIFEKIRDTIYEIWNAIKQKTSEIWNGIKDAIFSVINGIIGGINGMIRGIVSGLNGVIKVLNKLSFKIPSWVPEFGGKKFGFDIPKVSAPQIPYLASGAVIPPNKEFMAVLGDQKHGNNIEAPEGLIRRIVREESKGGLNGKIEVPVYLDRYIIAKAVIDGAKVLQMQSGRNPFDLA